VKLTSTESAETSVNGFRGSSSMYTLASDDLYERSPRSHLLREAGVSQITLGAGNFTSAPSRRPNFRGISIL